MTRTVFPMTTAGRNRIAALVACTAALALLVSACGGGSKTTASTTTTTATTSAAAGEPLAKAVYVRRMTAIGRSLGASLNKVESAQTTKQAAAAYRGVQIRLRLAQRQMEAITPPSAIAKEHAALAKAVGDFANELGPIVQQIEGGDITAATKVAKLHGYLELRAAAAAITKAGYKIGT